MASFHAHCLNDAVFPRLRCKITETTEPESRGSEGEEEEGIQRERMENRV